MTLMTMDDKYELKYWFLSIGILLYLLAEGSKIVHVIGIIVALFGVWQIVQSFRTQTD